MPSLPTAGELCTEAIGTTHFTFAGLMENLKVYPQHMQKNLDLLGGVVNSQRLLLELARKGMDRQAAYVVVQRNAMRFFEENVDFKTALLSDADLAKVMSPSDIEACFSPGYHLRHVDQIFERVFGATPGLGRTP